MKPLTSGDIELNLNGQTILSVGSTMLLNMRLRQLGLRPVDVGGEGNFFSEQFLISYSVYGDLNHHLLIRQVGFQYLSNNPECFTESNTENSWNVYINNVLQDTWCDALSVQAVADCQNVAVHKGFH